MKLYISSASPFARKVLVVAHEKGLINEIEPIVVDPYANAAELVSANPVVQVPTLIARDGLPLSDSPAISEYLDHIGAGARLLPEDREAWLAVKRVETLGNQALEMGVKLVLEKRRPETEQSPGWIQRWTTNMERCLDALEASALSPDRIDMGTLTAAIAVTWIGFRHAGIDLETGRPTLMALTRAMETRDSFKATYPR